MGGPVTGGRTHETYLEGIRRWQHTPGTLTRKQPEHANFVPHYDQTREEDELPLVLPSAMAAAFPGLTWQEGVAGAMGELDPYALMMDRAEERVARAQQTHGLIGSDDFAALLGLQTSHFGSHERRKPGFPMPVAHSSRRRVWDATDAAAYVRGEPVPFRPHVP